MTSDHEPSVVKECSLDLPPTARGTNQPPKTAALGLGAGPELPDIKAWLCSKAPDSRHLLREMAFCLSALTLFTSTLVLGGCKPPPPNASINNVIISSAQSGSADDGDPATPPDSYNGPAKMSATDAATTAASNAPLFDTVGGNEHAIPAAASRADAVAKSNNKVVTEFVVNNQGAFTSDLNLDLQNVKVTGKGHIDVAIRANVLDKNGVALPGGGTIASHDLEIKPDPNPQAKPQVIIDRDADNPEHVAANNSYVRKLSAPNGGLQLQPDKYRIELELRLYGFAPIDPRSTAEVDPGTLQIVLKP
jgi:hypothetical protein